MKTLNLVFILIAFVSMPVKSFSQTTDSSRAIIQALHDEEFRIEKGGEVFNLQFWGLVTHHYYFSVHIFHGEVHTPLKESVYLCEIPKIEGSKPNCRFQEVSIVGEIPVLGNQPKTSLHISCINELSSRFGQEFPYSSIERIDSGVDQGIIHIQFSFMGIDELFNQKKYECLSAVNL
jgi:hypothetical protein